jgi:hypothetical protein
MNFLKTILAAGLTCAASLSHATTTVTTDFSDLWYNESEPGWGVNVIQQNDTLFVTLFVYGTNAQPAWYVASGVRLASTAGGTLTFSGPLYQTSGPWFGDRPFNTSMVTARQVGTLAFSASQISNATLTYNVDSTTVTKAIQRQTWAADNISGTFLGASIGTWSDCSRGRVNGGVESYAQLIVTQDGNAVQIREDGVPPSNYSCHYNGNYSQQGRMGTILGNGTCTDGVNSTFIATEVQASLQGLSMRVASSQINGTCVFVGRMGGMRR